jgi:hypothetical protein
MGDAADWVFGGDDLTYVNRCRKQDDIARNPVDVALPSL